jgi:nitroreductase
MCLAARAEGLGSTYTTLLTLAAAEVNRILGVPDDAGTRLFAALPMGYPVGKWGVAPRQPAHEVTFANRWGNPPTWRATPPSLGR